MMCGAGQDASATIATSGFLYVGSAKRKLDRYMPVFSPRSAADLVANQQGHQSRYTRVHLS